MVFRLSRGRSYFLAIIGTVVAACAIGESTDPGCHSDADCGADRICRGGACFRIIGDTDAGPTKDDAE